MGWLRNLHLTASLTRSMRWRIPTCYHQGRLGHVFREAIETCCYIFGPVEKLAQNRIYSHPPIIYFLAILKDLGWPKKTCQTSFTIYAWPQSGFFISKNISRGGNICFQSIKYQYLCAWYSQTQDFLQVIICVMVKLIWNPSVDWNDPIYHILHREAGIL